MTTAKDGLNAPRRVFVDAEGAMYVVDEGRNRILKFSDVAASTTLPVFPLPVLAAVSPGEGLSKGGAQVTLTGANFAAGATVKIGGADATDVQIVSSTRITAIIAPGSEGARDVVVTNPDGQSVTLAGGFHYVDRISPDFDDNGTVGFSDFLMFAGAFGSTDARYDLDGDGAVGFSDFLQFAAVFGQPAGKRSAVPD